MGRVQRARIGGLQCYPDMRYINHTLGVHVITVVLLSRFFFVFTFIPTLYLFALLMHLRCCSRTPVLPLLFFACSTRGPFPSSRLAQPFAAHIFGRRLVTTRSRCPPLVTLDNRH